MILEKQTKRDNSKQKNSNKQNILLIGGAPSVGKTGLIYRFTKDLIKMNKFNIISGFFPKNLADFKVVIEGNRNGKKIKVIINSASDNLNEINSFKKFHKGQYDILISSIRDIGKERNDFFNIMNIDEKDIIEVPLGKITRRNNNKNLAMKWYKEKMYTLIKHTLSKTPFNL